MRQSTATHSATPTLADLVPSFLLTLEARHRSPRTIQSYEEAALQFVAFCEAQGMPTVPASVTREHVEAWVAHLLGSHRSPSTAAVRYRSLQQYWKWLLEEGEVTRS